MLNLPEEHFEFIHTIIDPQTGRVERKITHEFNSDFTKIDKVVDNFGEFLAGVGYNSFNINNCLNTEMWNLENIDQKELEDHQAYKELINNSRG